MGYSLDFGVVFARWPELLVGAVMTLGLALAGMALAIVIGVLGVAARRSRFRVLRAAVIAFVEVVRNTPFLVQIFFIFFALPLMGLRFNPTSRRSSGLASMVARTPSRLSAAGSIAFARGRWRLGWRSGCIGRRYSGSSS